MKAELLITYLKRSLKRSKWTMVDIYFSEFCHKFWLYLFDHRSGKVRDETSVGFKAFSRRVHSALQTLVRRGLAWHVDYGCYRFDIRKIKKWQKQ